MRIAISCSVNSVDARRDLILSISAGEKYRPCDLRIRKCSFIRLEKVDVKALFKCTQTTNLISQSNLLRNQKMPLTTRVVVEQMCIRFDHCCELQLNE